MEDARESERGGVDGDANASANASANAGAAPTSGTTDADLVADARFLPNPFWIPDLRPHTGLDEVVSDYVLAQNGAEEFISAYVTALRPIFEGYQRENKRHATIAIGCTGGKHRSVAIAEELAARLRNFPGLAVNTKHRDLGRE